MQTSRHIEETVKVDVALEPVSLATTNKTGPFFPMKDWGRALFTVLAAAMAKDDTVVAQVVQATDRDGTSVKDVTGATATITSPTKAAEVTVTATTVVDGNVITISDGETTQVFTCEDTTPDADLGQFASGADDTAAMANLAVVVNKLLPKLKATSATNVLTVAAREPGEAVVSVSAESATMVPAVTKAVAYVELSGDDLDHNNAFTHVAVKVTTDATIVVASDIVRDVGRFSPAQKVAASAAL